MDGTVVGIDSSTQSCKVLVVELASGRTLAAASAPHPTGTAVDPWQWVSALREAWNAAGVPSRNDVVAVGVAGQQHGMVAVDEEGSPVHDALLWNDVRSADAARQLLDDLGVEGWIRAVNVLPVPAITITKLAWLRQHRPDAAVRLRRVMLPHDWLVLQLTGSFVTDRSDASGTGYFDAAIDTYRTDLLERYFGRVPQLPRVLGPSEVAGTLLPQWAGTVRDVAVSAGAGDNAAAALALDLQAGDVVLSVGTSGTVFTRTNSAIVDPTGMTAGFADASGGHLPLLCTINAARIMTCTASLLSVDLPAFDKLALGGTADAGGLTMLPYFEGERTPSLPTATGELHGLTLASFNPPNLAQAAVLAIANSLADCLAVLRGAGAPVRRVFLIGGGSRSLALRAALADTIGMRIEVPESGEYVARGAARQAAWAITGKLPEWERRIEQVIEPGSDRGAAAYRDRYQRLRASLMN